MGNNGLGTALGARWTQEQKARANEIVNDIAEGIDNGESRDELRQAVEILSDLLCDSDTALVALSTRLLGDAFLAKCRELKRGR